MKKTSFFYFALSFEKKKAGQRKPPTFFWKKESGAKKTRIYAGIPSFQEPLRFAGPRSARAGIVSLSTFFLKES